MLSFKHRLQGDSMEEGQKRCRQELTPSGVSPKCVITLASLEFSFHAIIMI